MLLRAMTVDVRGASVHCPVLSLVDRRSTRPRRKEWVLTKAVELCLFGPNDVRLQLPVVDIFFAADLSSLPTLAAHDGRFPLHSAKALV